MTGTLPNLFGIHLTDGSDKNLCYVPCGDGDEEDDLIWVQRTWYSEVCLSCNGIFLVIDNNNNDNDFDGGIMINSSFTTKPPKLFNVIYGIEFDDGNLDNQININVCY